MFRVTAMLMAMTAQTQDSLIPCATATPTTAVAVLAVAAVLVAVATANVPA